MGFMKVNDYYKYNIGGYFLTFFLNLFEVYKYSGVIRILFWGFKGFFRFKVYFLL